MNPECFSTKDEGPTLRPQSENKPNTYLNPENPTGLWFRIMMSVYKSLKQ